MIGHRATAGLTLLCALMLCAFAAQSVSAQVGTPAENTTAVTCVDVGTNKGSFEDAHCDKKVGVEKGKYEHKAFEKDKDTTEIEVTNKETKNSTKEATTLLLKLKAFATTVEMSCLTATTAGASKASWIQNVETPEKKHTVKGTVNILFKDCTVLKPLKCAIKEPIEIVTIFQGVENLKPGGKEMGVEFSGENAKSNFASLTLIDTATKECALKNKTFEMSGTMTATGGTATQTEKHSGATSVYVPNKEKEAKGAEEMQTLKIGLEPAYLTGAFTTRMAGGGNPIALTTNT